MNFNAFRCAVKHLYGQKSFWRKEKLFECLFKVFQNDIVAEVPSIVRNDFVEIMTIIAESDQGVIPWHEQPCLASMGHELADRQEATDFEAREALLDMHLSSLAKKLQRVL